MLEIININKITGVEDVVYRRCYFCEFDKTLQIHHIIQKCDGGLDEEENLVELCPNHHALIHDNKYIIQFSNGFLILINTQNFKDKILPFDKHNIYKRELPIKSIENAKKLNKLKEVDNG